MIVVGSWDMQVNQRETGGRSAIVPGGMWSGGGGCDGANRWTRAGTADDGSGVRAGMHPHGAELIVLACVVSAFGVSPAEIAGRSRGMAHVALARQVAMYMHHVVLRQTLTAVAKSFARDRTTVAHACRVVEDRRDDPAFEELLDAIERAVQGALGPLCQSRRGQG
jgi:hypothetical protein